MYSDVIKKDEDEDAKQRLFNKPSTSDEAAPLPLLMVRQEDPLAALKVRSFKRLFMQKICLNCRSTKLYVGKQS